MSKELKWEFSIKGDSQYFRCLSESQSSLYFNIYGGYNDYLDCMSDDFYLTSVYIDNEDDPDIVWQIGYELTSLFNGALIILNKEFRKLELKGLLCNGTSVKMPEKKNVFALLGKANISGYIYNQEFKKLLKGDVCFFMMNLATEREDVYMILKYFIIEGSYVNYYKTLESLESLSKNTGIIISIDKKLRKSFTNTANNYTISGLESRHGFNEAIKENKTQTMTLPDAHTFVSLLAKEYLNNLMNGIIRGEHPKSFRINTK